MDKFKQQTIRMWLRSWAACGAHPGLAVGIWKDGINILYEDSNHKNDNSINRNTIYRIYSMTKPITIVGIMILVAKGLICVDDCLEKYIPEFANPMVFVGGTADDPIVKPATRSITIKDLMMHTSGIGYGFFSNHVPDQILKRDCPDYVEWFRNTPCKDLCSIIAKVPLLFNPGEKWQYGLNIDILGRVIEIVSGQTLDVYFKHEIFDPLGMKDTAFFVTAEEKHRLAPCWAVVPGQCFVDISGQPERDRSCAPPMLAGGGGLVSTIDDYAAFCNMLVKYGAYTRPGNDAPEQLLPKELVIELSTNHIPNNGELINYAYDTSFSEAIGEGIGFGYGVSVIVRPEVARGAKYSSVGEYGWGGVASTFFSICPAQQVFCVMMTQLMPSSTYPARAQLRYLCYWACNDDADEDADI